METQGLIIVIGLIALSVPVWIIAIAISIYVEKTTKGM